MAAMISGAQLHPGRLAIDYITQLGGVRQASVFGTRLLTSPVNAALANGMLAHADETDDSHAPSRTHPGCAVIPAALAVAESVQAGGERLIRAVVLGYDVAARLNYALGPDEFAAASRATHSVGGTFGAGAAAGALLALDDQQVRHLLSFCAQQASGVGCSVRDSEHVEKAFDFGGMPARNGVTAAAMVAAGFTGVDDVFSGERNFFEAYAPRPDPDRLAEDLGQRFEIMGTNIKKWSVGSPAQSALDAMTVLMEADRLRATDVESIEVHLPTRSARTVDNAPMPDVNVQHLLAMLLIDRTLSFEAIHDRDRMQDPVVLALRQKVAIVPSEELMTAIPRRQAIVAVKTRDGRSLSQRTVAVRGTADNPMTQAEVEAKASDLIGGVLGARRANAVVDAMRNLETIPDVTALRRLWQPAAKRSAPRRDR
jgi:2-methylcitrate dehydratase PrpD